MIKYTSMNNSRFSNTIKILLTGIIMMSISTFAIGQSFVLNVQYNPMSFTNSARTVLYNAGNGGLNQGSIHKYANVITISGITVYAKMTILEVNNAFITNFDDDVITGDSKRFQPRIGSNSNGGYIKYQLEFFNTANNAPVFLYNYWLTGVDIDGGDDNKKKETYREFVEIGGYSSYQVDATTKLTITSNSSTGTTRFKGRAGSLDGITFENTACFIANYSNPNNKITFALGITNQAISERYFSVQFGAPDPDGPFDHPVVTQNPLPVAVDDIGEPVYTTGGTSVNNVLTNDLYNGAPINSAAVNISLISSSNSGVVLNLSTGQVSVNPNTPPGTYTLTYKITMKNDASASDLADVTVVVLAASSDLEVSKTVNNATPNVGSNVIFTITAKNNGPIAATGVTVNDILPAGYTLVSATPSLGSWIAPNWSIGNLANGANATLTIVATVNATGSYANTATIAGSQTDPTPGNNTSTSTPVPTTIADLEITKTASISSLIPGQSFFYTISVKNNGPNTASAVLVNDVLPSSLNFVSATSSVGTWTAPNWSIGNLAKDEIATLTLNVSVKETAAAGSISNTALVTSITADPNSNNNTSVKTIPVTALSADLEITKSSSKSPVKPGETFTYTITLKNNGPNAASDVSVQDILPSSLTLVEVNPSVGTWTAPNWAVGNLASGVSKTLSMTVSVKSTASGNIVNTATVTSSIADPNSNNNTSIKTIPVTALSADLEISKTASKDIVEPEETFTYSITVKNNGPDAATNVNVEDILPSSLNFIEANPSVGTWIAPNWSVGTIANGASKTLIITVKAKADASGSIINIAIVTSSTSDPHTSNNSANKTITVRQPALNADLSITKTAESEVIPGQNLRYIITVTNNGPDDATGVRVTDNLPTTVNFISTYTINGTWSAPTWDIGNLAKNTSAVLYINVTPKDGTTGSLANTASVASTTPDSNMDNNISTVRVNVIEPEKSADLEISKTASKNPVQPGETFTYTISVKNNGPDAATNVSVQDILASSLTLVETNPAVGTWAAPNWTIGTLASGVTKSLILTVTVNPNASGSIVNTTTVTSSTSDPNTENNTATKVITIQAVELRADLEISKNASKNPVQPGETFTYTISVKNNGPDAAANVSVQDVLPTSLNFIEANPSVGTWNAPNWTIGSLANGAIKTLTMTVSAKTNASGNIVNTATVTSTTTDPNSNNNSSTKTINVEDQNDIINHFPASGYGTLAFEDLWPGKGDYDFNDLVLDYQFEIKTNTNNKVDQVIGTFIIKAFGAALENGFGFQLSSNIVASDLNVSGYSLTENIIHLNGNGTEAGQSKPTIIVYDNAFNQMQHPGIGIGVNTDPAAPYVTPDTIRIVINFPANRYTFNDLDISNFNPFLIVNLERGVEVHLPDYPPTSLVDQSKFRTYDDNSNPSIGVYYKTVNNLPWAINIYESFAYPIEKKDITSAHLKFAQWAISGGVQYPNWYQNLAGNRNDSNIYQLPF